VADLAFISLSKVLPALRRCAPDAELLLLVKPQFEAARELVGKGGVVRDPGTWRDVLIRIATALGEQGCSVLGATASPIAGPAGNREFFLHAASAAEPAFDLAALDAAIAECQTR
jgi:23S rRNA (cytidine1920-2'-O)/16S rRNA (cytidine1409-2'-O)-methyltransferase